MLPLTLEKMGDFMKPTIILVEDDTAIAQNYTESLQLQGYQVLTYSDVESAKQGFLEHSFDLAILDITLGDQIEGGYELCQWLRTQHPNCGIIILSSRDSDFDTVTGLRLGADDYLTKTTAIGVILARIVAVLRRTQQSPSSSAQLQVGPLTLDTETLSANWHGQTLHLTVTECLYVKALIQAPGQVCTRDALMKGASICVDDATISSQIKRIRKKFTALEPSFNKIETVYGLGYRWNTSA